MSHRELPRSGRRKKKFAIITCKGGTGKTTNCLNVAGALAERGSRVLVVDCDPQGDASSVLAKMGERGTGYVGDLHRDANVRATDVVQQSRFDNISFIASDARLNRIEKTHGFEDDAAILFFMEAISELEKAFDYVLFDCAGAVHLTGFAAMAAADEVVVPVEPSQFSLRNIHVVNEAVHKLREAVNPNLEIRYVLSKVGREGKPKRMARVARTALTKMFGKGSVMKIEMPDMVIFQTAVNLSKPIVFHAKRSRAAGITRRFASELIGVNSPRWYSFPSFRKWQQVLVK